MKKRGKSNAKVATSTLRIIGGQWRSRRLNFPAIDGLRPTTDRLRETLFNWLAPAIYGANCLDLFAGSGALGLEALSRGAQHATFIDLSSQATNALRQNLDTLQCANATVYQDSADQWLQHNHDKYDVIFLDPPFRKSLLQTCVTRIDQASMLNEGAFIYLEMESELNQIDIPENWQVQKEKMVGQVRCLLLQNLP